MERPQHHQAFFFTVLWTLGLLLLGSVVHATESSLACPDWPTCFGSLVPEMTGGVFWEHLHRLVAGGLILFFLAATYLAWREETRYRWVVPAALAGVGLLLVQAVLGGITVLLRLPDAVSTSHLGLAFLFLGLATVLAAVSWPGWRPGVNPPLHSRMPIRRWTLGGIGLVFLQSLVGAAVRHTDAGMACPDVPLCLGRWIPPLDHSAVALHFGHRVLGVALLAVVLRAGHLAFWRGGARHIRLLGVLSSSAALTQVLLGFLSVHLRLAVMPVSLHTLLAATLLCLMVLLATFTWAPATVVSETGVGPPDRTPGPVAPGRERAMRDGANAEGTAEVTET